MAAVLEEVGIVFMFAPLLHPAMRHVGPVRRGLGVHTVMNLLGPLTNPAGARRQVVGVSDPALLDLLPLALSELGHLRALVVHGAPGIDEVSPLGVTYVAEVRGESVTRYELEVSELGLEAVTPEGLRGGEPDDNAQIIESVLAGAAGAPRSAVVANAAAALLVADRAESWPEAAELARRTIDSGAAADALQLLRSATNR